MRIIYYIGLATLYWTAGHISEYRRKTAEAEISQLNLARDNAQLETSLAHTRNAYLQQQMNPHLLFNTLNFIYSTVYKHSAAGGKAVLLLAELMRFSLKETDRDGKVMLSSEIEQLENLVTLNRYRYHYPLEIEFTPEGNHENYTIIPLILLTLAENMFKHGDFKDKSAVIRLSVSENGFLRFSTQNARRHNLARRNDRGIGITNTRLRLDHSYKNKYSLNIRETTDIFQIDLNLQL